MVLKLVQLSSPCRGSTDLAGSEVFHERHQETISHCLNHLLLKISSPFGKILPIDLRDT